jgi:hypothetical protein
MIDADRKWLVIQHPSFHRALALDDVDMQVILATRQVALIVRDSGLKHRSRGAGHHSTGTGILNTLWQSLEREVRVALPRDADLTSVQFEISDFGFLLSFTTVALQSPVGLRKSIISMSMSGPLGGLNVAPSGKSTGKDHTSVQMVVRCVMACG